MTIGKIHLSDIEMRQAVQSWLSYKGITVTVACVQRSYLKSPDEWEVTGVTADEQGPVDSAPSSLLTPLTGSVVTKELEEF